MQARDEFPPQVDTRLGPIATGLSEIYMWTVRYKKFDIKAAQDGEQGWQRRWRLSNARGNRAAQFCGKRSLSPNGARLDHPSATAHRAGRRSASDSLGGFVKQYHVQPDPAKLTALGLSFGDLAAVIDRNNLSRGAGYLERNGEGLVVHSGGRLGPLTISVMLLCQPVMGPPYGSVKLPLSRSVRNCALAAPV